jgi:hypothetical protein
MKPPLREHVLSWNQLVKLELEHKRGEDPREKSPLHTEEKRCTVPGRSHPTSVSQVTPVGMGSEPTSPQLLREVYLVDLLVTSVLDVTLSVFVREVDGGEGALSA